MRAYHSERLQNAICYFAREHAKRTGCPTYQTHIFKYLALFDFKMLEIDGIPGLDIEYKAMPMGPVPKDLYDHHRSTEVFSCEKVGRPSGGDTYLIVPQREPDMDYFSEEEKSVMDGLLDEFATPFPATDPMIAATHDRILSWKKAWARRGSRKSVPMRYDDNFTEESGEEKINRFQMHKELDRYGRRGCDPVGAV